MANEGKFARGIASQRDLTCRQATLRAKSVNEKDRSVEAVLATQRIVTVFDSASFRAIDEVLLMSGAEPVKYLPLLNNHNRSDLEDVLGSVKEVWTEKSRMLGVLFFAEGSADSLEEKCWRKVKGGHLRDVSVGYQVIDAVDIPPGKSQSVAGKNWTAGERMLRVTTEWKPFEVSLTPVGADEAAKIRDGGGRSKIQEIELAITSQVDTELTRSQIVREMASAAGLSSATVRGILSGKKRARREDLRAFVDVLGLD